MLQIFWNILYFFYHFVFLGSFWIFLDLSFEFSMTV